MKFHRIEQVEIQSIGGWIYVSFRNVYGPEHGISQVYVRLYSCITDASLGRIVRALNDPALFKLRIKQDGRILSFIADRNHDQKWNIKITKTEMLHT